MQNAGQTSKDDWLNSLELSSRMFENVTKITVRKKKGKNRTERQIQRKGGEENLTRERRKKMDFSPL